MPPKRAFAGSRDEHLSFAKTFPFFNLIGLEVVEMKPGLSTTRIAWRDDLCQPAGILHGGVIAALTDTGIAHALLLTDVYKEYASRGGYIVSVDLRVRYFRPVAEGTIVCESTIPRLGRQIMHGESIISNEQGKEIARGESIYMGVLPEPRQSRRGDDSTTR